MSISETPRALPRAVLPLAPWGERPALHTGSGAITYAELADRVDQAAAALGAVRRLVLLDAAPDPDAVVALLAALAGGHPVLLTEPGSPLGHQLAERYDPDVVLSQDAGWELEERRAGTAHDLHPDLALLLSTSGSTGSPKGVRLSHRNLGANAAAIAGYLGLTPDDRAITSLPLHYCYGLSVLTSHLSAGAGVVLTGASVVDPCFWTAFAEHGATSLAGVPHTFDLLERGGFADRELPTLRYLTQAGGRMAPEVVRRFADLGAERGWDLFVMYGQTEATARMAYVPPHRVRDSPSAIGLPIPGGRFWLDRSAPGVDPADPDVGELVYEGPNVMLGYAASPADLADGPTTSTLHTGDLARQGEGGLYEVVGRSSRFLKLFGLRVDLDQVEGRLRSEGMAATCTGDDERLVVAVATDDDQVAAARAVARTLTLPPSAVQVLTLEQVPLLASGKPDYPAIRDAARRAQQPKGRASSVRAILAAHLGVHQVGDDDTFVSLGGDSLSYVEVSVAIEDLLGYLPPGWHHEAVGHLDSLPPRRTRWAQAETTVVLRALAITMIVARHVGTLAVAGGAHLLLAVSGFNVARFQLHPSRAARPSRSLLTAAAKIAVPSAIWLAVVALATGRYGLTHVLLIHDLGRFGGDTRWRYWFIEAIVQILVALAALFAVPAVDRLDRRRPLIIPSAVVATALALRLGPWELAARGSWPGHVTSVLICFMLGWLAERCRSTTSRLVLSATAVAAIPGLFATHERSAVVAVALLLLVWAPTVPVPRAVVGALGLLAGGSLYIYLTHWQVYPVVSQLLPALLVVPVTLAVGVGVWRAVEWCTGRWRSRRRPAALPSPATAV